MKIALNVKSIDTLHGGGERYVVNLARALIEHGHEVHAFAMVTGDEAPGLHVHEVRVPKFPKTLRDWRFARRSGRALASEGFDLVFGTGKSPWVDVYRPGGGMHMAYVRQDALSAGNSLSRAARWAMRMSSPKEWINLWLERRTMRSPRLLRLIVNSDMVKRDVARCCPWFDPARVTVLYNGVDVRQFHPGLRDEHRSAVRQELGLASDDVVALLVGNNFRLKGVAQFLRAMATLHARGISSARGLVVGKGRVGRAKRLARRLGLGARVVFAGGRRDMPALYGAADMLAHPTFYDPCANVTLEAFAAGLPVVTTRFNGASGLMTQGIEGFVLDDPNRIDKLANALQSLMHEPKRLGAGAQARALAERNSMDRYYERIISIFEDVAAERQGR